VDHVHCKSLSGARHGLETKTAPHMSSQLARLAAMLIAGIHLVKLCRGGHANKDL